MNTEQPILFGGYEIGPEIGSGAMGAVHLAHDRFTQMAVALKRIHEKYIGQKQTLRRFAIEVQTASRLRHNNIVSVISSGIEPRGTPYCVMEWVSGYPLSCWARSKLPWSSLSWILADLLDALAYAHARGVVHRDLKPANLLIENPFGSSPRLRLTDFGIARLLEADDEETKTQLTMDDRVLGTPAYLSPEQAQGYNHLIGPHTDLYAFGVLLYELILGRLPFEGLPVMKLLMAHVATPAPPLDLSNRSDVPREAIQLARDLLAKPVDKRPDSARAIRDALQLEKTAKRGPLPVVDELEGDWDALGDLATDVDIFQTASIQDDIDLALVEPPDLLSVPVLLGRDAEFEDLLSFAEAVECDNRARLVLVHGEAGLGKSRLVHELRYHLEEEGRFRGGRLRLQGGVSEDEAIRTVVGRLLFCENARGTRLRDRLAEAAQRYGLSQLERQALRAWFEDQQGSKRTNVEFVDAAVAALLKVAAKKPLVLVLEAVEGATSGFTLDVLTGVLDWAEQAKNLLVFCTARNGPTELAGAFKALYLALQAQNRAFDVPLAPLPESVLADLVRPLVGSRAEELAARAGGNPLFVLELARYRIGATMAEDGIDLTLPGSFDDVWRSRIEQAVDSASEPLLTRCVLNTTALLGPSVRRMHINRVVSAANGVGEENIDRAIDELLKADILTIDSGRNPAIDFAHTVAFEYVTAQIDGSDDNTVRLLQTIADWMMAPHAVIGRQVVRRLQQALEASGDLARVNRLQLLSGELLMDRLDYVAAQPELEGALQRATQRDDRSLEICAAAELANTFIFRGELEKAAKTLTAYDVDEAIDSFEAMLLELSPITRLLKAKSHLAAVVGRNDEAIKLLETGVRLVEPTGDSLALAELRTELSKVLEADGRLADAERACRKAIDTFEECEAKERNRAGAFISLASLCHRQGRMAEASEAGETALDLAEEAGSIQQVDRALEVLLRIADARGQVDQAVGLAEQILEHQQVFGDRLGMINTRTQLGILERRRGNFEKTDQHHRQALKLLEDLPEPRLFVANILSLGITLYQQGRFTQAVDHLNRARDIAAELKDTSQINEIEYRLALVLRADGEPARAEELVRAVLRAKLELGEYNAAARCQVLLGAIAADRSNWSIARELFSEARSMFASMVRSRHRTVSETWLALTDANLGKTTSAIMLTRDVEELLTKQPVFDRLLVEGLQRLAEKLEPEDQEMAWRLDSKARQIENRLKGGTV